MAISVLPSRRRWRMAPVDPAQTSPLSPSKPVTFHTAMHDTDFAHAHFLLLVATHFRSLPASVTTMVVTELVPIATIPIVPQRSISPVILSCKSAAALIM